MVPDWVVTWSNMAENVSHLNSQILDMLMHILYIDRFSGEGADMECLPWARGSVQHLRPLTNIGGFIFSSPNPYAYVHYT